MNSGEDDVVVIKTIVIILTCGIPAAPILAAVAVMEMMTIWLMLGSIPVIWAIKMAATASYRAVPSMLMVAPMGSTNLGQVEE